MIHTLARACHGRPGTEPLRGFRLSSVAMLLCGIREHVDQSPPCEFRLTASSFAPN